MTTSGVATSFNDPEIMNPDAITTGPDGALWFTNSGIYPTYTASIGRMPTSGVVTDYTDPGIVGGGYGNATSIANGSDGALWFTTGLNNSIGRIVP